MKNKILVLALSGGAGPHEQNENVQKLTWGQSWSKLDEIFWIKCNPNISDTIIDYSERQIYVPLQETISNLFAKTLFAMKTSLREFDFTHILRTNTSSYLTENLVKQKLNSLPTENFYGGFISEYTSCLNSTKKIRYVSGASIWLSRDLVHKLVKKIPSDYSQYVDDVAIGTIFNHCQIHSIKRINATDFEPIFPVTHTRVKCLTDENLTVRRMQQLDRIYKSTSSNELKNNLFEYDESEIEHLNSTDAFTEARKFYLQNRFVLTRNIRLQKFRNFLFK